MGSAGLKILCARSDLSEGAQVRQKPLGRFSGLNRREPGYRLALEEPQATDRQK